MTTYNKFNTNLDILDIFVISLSTSIYFLLNLDLYLQCMKNMNNVVMNMLFFDILIFLFCKSPWIHCINEYFFRNGLFVQEISKSVYFFFIINKPIMKFVFVVVNTKCINSTCILQCIFKYMYNFLSVKILKSIITVLENTYCNSTNALT